MRNKTTVFTLCSNNYLAHAKTLGDSLMKNNPAYHFVIGLVDVRHSEIDYSFFEPYEVLSFEAIGFPVLAEMLPRYNVIEFNTAVKPFYFQYLFNRNGEDCVVYYLDPDIACFASFHELDQLLETHTYLVTPHLTKPLLRVSAFETMILNTGVYNLGFIGIRNTGDSANFLKWWQERMKEYCLINYAKGLFVDQIWVNFLTVFFQNVYVVKSPAYNMACWNFHERTLLVNENTYAVNSPDCSLVFFHFSGFKPTDMKYICKIKTDEFTMDARPDLSGIFHSYARTLYDNQYEKLSALKPLLNFGSRKYTFKQRIGRSLKFRTNKIIKRFFEI